MRRALVIVIAVAILGLVSIFNNKQMPNSSAQAILGANSSRPSSSASSPAANPDPSTNIVYKDGTYTGSREQNIYGPVQVAAIISGGKIADIKFLQMPSDEPQSRQHTADAEPLLKNSAINNQSAHIDFVSGATDTSQSFEQSLQAALNQAVVS